MTVFKMSSIGYVPFKHYSKGGFFIIVVYAACLLKNWPIVKKNNACGGLIIKTKNDARAFFRLKYQRCFIWSLFIDANTKNICIRLKLNWNSISSRYQRFIMKEIILYFVDYVRTKKRKSECCWTKYIKYHIILPTKKITILFWSPHFHLKTCFLKV